MIGAEALTKVKPSVRIINAARGGVLDEAALYDALVEGRVAGAGLDVYATEFGHSGFFGPVSYYRNLDANAALVAGMGADRLTMPSFFITGDVDVVRLMDPSGIERMQGVLPDFRGAVVIPEAGHWVQQEAPRAFNDALLGMLRSL